MKVLTLTEPWATLVAVGAKHIETRSWGTAYRGPLAIHAAKTFPADARALCGTDPFFDTLTQAGFDLRDTPLPAQFHLGQIIAVAKLVDCARYEELERAPNWPIIRDRSIAPERAFGNYGPGRWCWIFANVQRLSQPIPAKGALGLWTYPSPINL